MENWYLSTLYKAMDTKYYHYFLLESHFSEKFSACRFPTHEPQSSLKTLSWENYYYYYYLLKYVQGGFIFPSIKNIVQTHFQRTETASVGLK